MGNRAVVVFADPAFQQFSPGIYLHWNGGPESVYQFLAELDRRGVRADQDYEAARFVQIVGEFFSGNPGKPYESRRDAEGSLGLSLGLLAPPTSMDPAELEKLNPGDNGVFIVSRAGETGNPGRHPIRKTVVKRYYADKLRPDDEVAAEHDAALKDKYADPVDGLPAFFAKLRVIPAA